MIKNKTEEEKKQLLKSLEWKYNLKADEKPETWVIVKEEFTPDKLFEINNKITSEWKNRILEFVQWFDWYSAKASEIRNIADVIDQCFKQNQLIEGKPTWDNMTLNIDIKVLNNFLENARNR